MTEAELALGELRGFLEAFARFNDKSDHGCTFTFDQLPDAETMSKSIESYFRGEATKILVTPVEHWQEALRGAFRKWLFQFQEVRMAHLVDKGKSFSFSHEFGRENVLEWAMKRLESIVHPQAVGKIDVETKHFYECDWDDFVLAGADASYLLHLGVSD